MTQSRITESSPDSLNASTYVADDSSTGSMPSSVAESLSANLDLQEQTAEPAKQVELRGTLRRHQATPKHVDTIRSQQHMPQSRQDGSYPYLRQLLLTSIPLAITDLAVLFVTVTACHAVGLQWLNPDDVTSLASVWLPPVAMAMLLVNAANGLYPGIRLGTVDEMRRLWLSITIVALITASGMRHHPEIFWKKIIFLVVAYVLCIIIAPFARSRVRRLLAKTSWWGFPTLVCGDDALVFRVSSWLTDNRRLGLRPVGIVTSPEMTEFEGDTQLRTEKWQDAHTLAESQNAYWAVLVESSDDKRHVTSVVDENLGSMPHVFVVSELTGIPDHWNHHQMDEGLPGFQIDQHLLLPIPRLIKRGMDLFLATVAGLLLAPLFLFLAVAIKLTSPGPIFFGHERVGMGNTRFRAWKFRTMVQGAEGMIEEYLCNHPELRDEWERDHKLKNDPRVTKLGKFMRKWSIDELPQIWNVLCGEMSTVGPRPIVPNEIATYGNHFESFCTVLPGMTGLWQVCGRNNTTFDVRIQLGMYYIHHWSPWLDLYLIAKTIRTVLFAKGAY